MNQAQTIEKLKEEVRTAEGTMQAFTAVLEHLSPLQRGAIEKFDMVLNGMATKYGELFELAIAGHAVKRALKEAKDDLAEAVMNATPEEVKTACKGLNCTSTDGHGHSPECEAEHAATIAGGTFTPATQQNSHGG